MLKKPDFSYILPHSGYIGVPASINIKNRMADEKCEQPETNFMVQHPITGKRVLHLGGGVGPIDFLYLAQGNEVYSIEPNKHLRQFFDKAVRLNEEAGRDMGRLVREWVSVGSTFGTDDLAFGSRPNLGSTNAGVGRDRPNIIAVPRVTFSSLVEAFSPTVLHCDVEGAEEFLLNEDLSVFGRILIEVHPRIIGYDACVKIINYIKDFGFEIIAEKKLRRNSIDACFLFTK